MRTNTLVTLLVLFSQVVCWAGAALDPVPVSDKHWRRRHLTQRDYLKIAPADVCFVGDSITEEWLATGRTVWEHEFRGWRKVNCGISGDTAENVLWRVQQYDLKAREPRVIVLLAGTNNLSQETPRSPEQVAATVASIIDDILARTKQTEIVLLSLLPNGFSSDSKLRKDVRETNKLLAGTRAESRLTWLDVHDAFLQQDGKWKESLTLDGTHLSAAGYKVLTSALLPTLELLLDVVPGNQSLSPTDNRPHSR